MRPFAYFLFVEPDLQERASDLVLFGRLPAGAKIRKVIGIYAINDRGDSASRGQNFQFGQKRVYAVKTPIGGIGPHKK